MSLGYEGLGNSGVVIASCEIRCRLSRQIRLSACYERRHCTLSASCCFVLGRSSFTKLSAVLNRRSSAAVDTSAANKVNARCLCGASRHSQLSPSAYSRARHSADLGRRCWPFIRQKR